MRPLRGALTCFCITCNNTIRLLIPPINTQKQSQRLPPKQVACFEKDLAHHWPPALQAPVQQQALAGPQLLAAHVRIAALRITAGRFTSRAHTTATTITWRIKHVCIMNVCNLETALPPLSLPLPPSKPIRDGGQAKAVGKTCNHHTPPPPPTHTHTPRHTHSP